jgi:hypothetical protein
MVLSSDILLAIGDISGSELYHDCDKLKCRSNGVPSALRIEGDRPQSGRGRILGRGLGEEDNCCSTQDSV